MEIPHSEGLNEANPKFTINFEIHKRLTTTFGKIHVQLFFQKYLS